MITGLYRAAAGMTVAQKQYETAAENLANVQMPGYRRRAVQNVSFGEAMKEAGQSQGSNVSQDPSMAASQSLFDFTQGRLDETQRKLDFAITGEGFFMVEGPDGPLATRNGSFHVDSGGQLVTIDQLPVLGTNGRITIPGNRSSEQITASDDGALLINGEEFATLQLVRFENPQILEPVGASLFAIPDNAVQQPADVSVKQGYLELSNVSIITELISLMEASRHFEVSQRAINMIEQSTQKRISA